MLRHIKTWCGLCLAMAMAPQAQSFTIWGPLETFQTAGLSYGTRFFYSPNVAVLNQPPSVPGNVPYTELGGPKNFGEGSRLNVPTITYAYDYTFLVYFGMDGVRAVDSAFAILNNLPAVSSASPDLSEFITQGNQQINYTARALSMLDLKSVVLQIMIEHMGLLGETHVFDMMAVGATCDSWYEVGVRNYDPITWNPSTYVNGTQYAYTIEDTCSIGTAISDAMEQANDVAGAGLSLTSSAVATQEALQLGGYYLGITRDDFGGLRYLYRRDNYNNEAMPPLTYVATNLGLFSPYSPASTNGAGGGTSLSPFNPAGTNTTATLDAAWTGTVGGMEKITFVRVGYDSGVGFYFPTNVIHYKIPILTNSMRAQLDVWRTNTAPDIIFTAANLLGTPGASEDQPFTRTVTFIAPPLAAVNPLSTVSEVISPAMTVTLNNVGPIYYNLGTAFTGGSAFYLYPYFQFGSFNGSTNAPIAFPSGTSLSGLIDFELSIIPGANAVSPFNPIISTNTTTAAGTGGGTVLPVAAAVARPVGAAGGAAAGGDKSP